MDIRSIDHAGRYANYAPITLALAPLDAGDTRQVYIQVADRIRDSIRDGRLRQARPIPTARIITAYYRVSSTTLTRAIELLTAEGIVRTVNGVRTFVCGMPPAGKPTNKQPCSGPSQEG